ncbi:glucosamine-6-phosphate deaminase [Pumilibacter muris]|uniref:glucosamine-6-phosphate deaminase n=1 Tax=Pumilibacter muris TaxID=2941510 RepID=UPI002041103C|nr:glucosamine-6-phosphate deaminase [Pumilibacter muris]
MKIIIVKDYEKVSDKAFEIMKEVVSGNPEAVLGLATGTTPLGLYARMIADHEENGTSYARVKAANLDEYAGVGKDNPNSYAYFMRKNLFDKIDIKLENTHIENGMALNADAECKRYAELLANMPRDIQVLGIGSNGHIAFNEPGTPFDSVTHTVELAESTVRDNARLFDRIEDVPRKAFTMGLSEIMQAKKILILATGANKADAVYGMIRGEVTEQLPASILRKHPDCVLICDEAAGSRLKN